MAFVPAYAGQVPPKETKHCQRCKDPSRRAFTIGAAALVAAHFIGPVRAQPEVDDAVTWAKEELCYVCGGRGQVPCMLCDGTGKFAVDDGVVVDRAVQCPNCGGSKVVGCLKCIGTGLAAKDMKGFLRDASRDGRIRVRRNGTYAVLKCDAIPSCALYGLGRSDTQT